jgi:hypothetical protein
MGAQILAYGSVKERGKNEVPTSGAKPRVVILGVKDEGAVACTLNLGISGSGFGGKEHGDEVRSRILSVSGLCSSTSARVHRPSYSVETTVGQWHVLKSATEEGYGAAFMMFGSGVEDGCKLKCTAHYALGVHGSAHCRLWVLWMGEEDMCGIEREWPRSIGVNPLGLQPNTPL